MAKCRGEIKVKKIACWREKYKLRRGGGPMGSGSNRHRKDNSSNRSKFQWRGLECVVDMPQDRKTSVDASMWGAGDRGSPQLRKKLRFISVKEFNGGREGRIPGAGIRKQR